MRERKCERERERLIFLPLVHFPNAGNSHVWVRLKPGSMNSTQISLIRNRGSSIWTILCCFPRAIIVERVAIGAVSAEVKVQQCLLGEHFPNQKQGAPSSTWVHVRGYPVLLFQEHYQKVAWKWNYLDRSERRVSSMTFLRIQHLRCCMEIGNNWATRFSGTVMSISWTIGWEERQGRTAV